MKLSFAQPHKSIQDFNSIELPDFTVLTGVNGSGKTHLLEAIKDNHCRIQVQGKDVSDSILFNYLNFRINFNEIKEDQRRKLGNQTNNFVFQLQYQGTYSNLRDLCLRIIDLKNSLLRKKPQDRIKIDPDYSIDIEFSDFMQFGNIAKLQLSNLGEWEEILLKKIPSYTKQTFSSVHEEGIKIIRSYLKQRVKTFCIEFTTFFKNLKEADAYTKSIFDILEKRKTSILQLNLGDIFFEDYTLGGKFTKETRKFKMNRAKLGAEEGIRRRSKNLKSTQPSQTDKADTPWFLLNRVLEQYMVNDFRLYDEDIPEPEIFKDSSNYIIQDILLRSTEDGTKVSINDLSTGEKTLIALSIFIYQQRKGKFFPKILLLDEIDSHLHPTMVKKFINTLQEIFIREEGMKIIMVTHSPATIAHCPEDSIFVVHRNGDKKVEKKSKNDALDILTDGFVSLTESKSNLIIEDGIQQTDKNVVVFTEGITDKIILETAWKKLYPNSVEKKFLIQQAWDAPFLRNLFKRGEIFEQFPEKKFIALFDFDAEGYNQWSQLGQSVNDDQFQCLCRKLNEKGFALLLPVPKNDLQKQVFKQHEAWEAELSIELLFYGYPKLMSHFVEEKVKGGGKVIRFVGDKTKFAKEVVKGLTEDDFTNFKALFAKIKEIASID